MLWKSSNFLSCLSKEKCENEKKYFLCYLCIDLLALLCIKPATLLCNSSVGSMFFFILTIFLWRAGPSPGAPFRCLYRLRWPPLLTLPRAALVLLLVLLLHWLNHLQGVLLKSEPWATGVIRVFLLVWPLWAKFAVIKCNFRTPNLFVRVQTFQISFGIYVMILQNCCCQNWLLNLIQIQSYVSWQIEQVLACSKKQKNWNIWLPK